MQKAVVGLIGTNDEIRSAVIGTDLVDMMDLSERRQRMSERTLGNHNVLETLLAISISARDPQITLGMVGHNLFKNLRLPGRSKRYLE